MATRKPRRFEGGGEILPKEVDSQEAADKAAGLKASKDEDVGFFGRLRMGNIDDPSSEAYKRFGAGRGRAERVPVEDIKPAPVVRETAKVEVDPLEEANKRTPIDVPAGPRATSSAKPVARPSAPPPRVEKKDPPESYKKIERQRDTVPFVKIPDQSLGSRGSLGADLRSGKMGRRVHMEYPEDFSAALARDKQEKAAKAVRDDNIRAFSKRPLMSPFAKGGQVKKMAGGGMATSASRRADGIATKGKTRGRMC